MSACNCIIAAILLFASSVAQSQYLIRSLPSATETESVFSTKSAHYLPLFGAGDDNSSVIKGLVRYGNIKVEPEGKSKAAILSGEETVIYILDGTGILDYENKSIPVAKDDFVYIPEGMNFSLRNPRERTLSAFIMGFRSDASDTTRPSKRMMIANAAEVPFQVLGYHGPTTQFQLLMGTTESIRDRLAAAGRVTSLFVMDFAAGGTNIPHRHDNEEEIYYILRGKGDIVAGETHEGKELRHPSKEGDVFFFAPKTLIGFYSGNTECEEHARILAVRFKYPGK